MSASFLLWLPFATAAVVPSLESRQSYGGWTGGQCGNTTSSSAITLSVPATPSSNSFIVPGDFIGLGFDGGSINDYANQFSQNLVDNVADRIPGPIILRIGGTTSDRLTYDPNQEVPVQCVGRKCPAGSGVRIIVGPSYFEGFKAFPNQLMSIQAPMGPELNDTNIIDFMTLAYEALGSDRLAAVALGNEPDLYQKDYRRRYTAAEYANDAKIVEQIVQQALNLSESEVIFEAPDIAGYGNFKLTDVFEAGVNDNGLIKYGAEHWYQIDRGPRNPDYAHEQTLLMSHEAITSKYADTGYSEALAYIQQNTNASYILSETGSSLGRSPRYFQDAFDATLWLVDFHLYSMSIGVGRIDSTGRPSANHSLWVPNNASNNPALGKEYNPGPQVRAPWYGIPMVADFMGKAPGAVVNLLADDFMTAYAMYEPPEWWESDAANASYSSADSSSWGPPDSWGQHGPSKIAILNLNLWAANTGVARGSQTFAIPISTGYSNASSQDWSGGANIVLSRLHADAGVAAQGYDVEGDAGMITWAGETWSYPLDDGKGSLVQGVPQTENVPVCNGYAIVEVPDSEAVIVYLSQNEGQRP